MSIWYFLFPLKKTETRSIFQILQGRVPQKWFRKGDQNHLNQDRWDLPGAFGQGCVPWTPWAALPTSSQQTGTKVSHTLFPGNRPHPTTTEQNKHQLSPSTLLRVLLVTQPVTHKRWEPLSWSLSSRSFSVWSSTEKFKYFQQNSWLFLNAGLFSNGRQGKLNKEWNKRVQMLGKYSGKMLNLLRN